MFTLSPGSRILNQDEVKKIIKAQELHFNALGYEVDITSLTTMIQKISEQKFYHIPFAEYLPVKVGEGAWSSNLVTYRSYEMGGEFSKGIQNTGSDNSRLARADSAVDAITSQVHNWAKETGWSIMDIEMASKSGNWDLITSKEVSRKTNWDLGLQKVAFLGLDGDANFPGLLSSLPGVNVNLTTITQSFTSLAQSSPANLSAQIAGLLVAYRANNNHTANPTHLIMPEYDYLGLATASSPDFPLKSILQYMKETLEGMTRNPNFQILPCAYAQSSVSGSGVSQYILLNYDEKSVRMNVPVPYTTTLPNSLNNFNFSCVGYGTFTGVTVLRPLEMLQFQFTSAA